MELLTNPRLAPQDFDFFDENPLAPPPNDLDCVGNLNTGSGFMATHKEMTEGEDEQLLGTVMCIDGAVTGQFSDLPVTAVKFSLTLFTREARMKDHMWATLGYLPQIKVAESRGKKLFKESQHLEADDIDIFDGEGDAVDMDANDSDHSDDGLTDTKAQDFHFMLSVILDPLIKLQESGMLWDLMHRNDCCVDPHFKMCIPTVCCDTEEADALCGKCKPRTRNIWQLCRPCHVPTL